MKKIPAILMILSGSILVLISIMALVAAFNLVGSMQSAESIGYVFGSILFPLLLTVIGRWVFRKGMESWRRKNSAS
jgi:hypothetical protein